MLPIEKIYSVKDRILDDILIHILLPKGYFCKLFSGKKIL